MIRSVPQAATASAARRTNSSNFEAVSVRFNVEIVGVFARMSFHVLDQAEVLSLFAAWKAHHAVSYASAQEERLRLENFRRFLQRFHSDAKVQLIMVLSHPRSDELTITHPVLCVWGALYGVWYLTTKKR